MRDSGLGNHEKVKKKNVEMSELRAWNTSNEFYGVR